MSSHERWLDGAEPIRAGEEVDLEPLAQYLRENIPEIAERAELSIQQFPSGHSNLTYLVRAGAREYVLRRPPYGSRVKTAHDMGRVPGAVEAARRVPLGARAADPLR